MTSHKISLYMTKYDLLSQQNQPKGLQITQNVLKYKKTYEIAQTLTKHSKCYEIATNLRWITQVINNHPFRCRNKRLDANPVTYSYKKRSFFVLLCPRCARIPDCPPPAADTPRIPAGSAAPTSLCLEEPVTRGRAGCARNFSSFGWSSTWVAWSAKTCWD